MNTLAYAPSNIALVKYMGKRDPSLNLPENASLSFTLRSLCTLVESSLEKRGDLSFHWVHEAPRIHSEISYLREDGKDQIISKRLIVPKLDEKAQSRMFSHLKRVSTLAQEISAQSQLRFRSGRFMLRSANTFPESSGIASSASSFSALTLVGLGSFLDGNLETLEKVFRDPIWSEKITSLSRVGSGSSCRSFQGPWVYWEDAKTECLSSLPNFQMPKLVHFVVLISKHPKRVSSSLAHRLVQTSPLWEKRGERAGGRAKKLKEALYSGNLRQVSQIAWAEMWEMHSLFHTSAEPFSYWEPETLQGIQWLSRYQGLTSNDPSFETPPIVTLDAGPNLHLLVEKKFRDLWQNRLRAQFPNIEILEDMEGSGARLLSISPT